MESNRIIKRVENQENHNVPKFFYVHQNRLYLNLSNTCTNECSFCYRFQSNLYLGHNLQLQTLPNTSELIEIIDNPRKYREIVFCGNGEPTMRLGTIRMVAKWVKERKGTTRLNTNGQGNILHRRNIIPELIGLIDTMSISLNAENAEIYNKVCKPSLGPDTFYKVLDFVKDSVKCFPRVEITVVAIPEINLEKCEKLADDLGVHFRYRAYYKGT
jgi:TatD DNase family protein